MWRRWLLVAAAIFAFHNQAFAGASCASKENLKIVLDVGHTATDGGAFSARGVPEYAFNLSLAQRIKEELVKAGYSSAFLMVTQASGNSGLFQRVERASRMKADIFISIHHDSVADPYLERWSYEGEEQYYSDRSKGFTLHVSPSNRNYSQGIRLAESLADSLIGRGLAPTTNPELCMPKSARILEPARGIYQRRNLVVLDFTKMTAVLLESGVIVNRDEELAAESEERQQLIAEAVADGLAKFCGERQTIAAKQANHE